MTEREDEILRKIKNLLLDYFEPSKIILFGSRSKATNSKSSDFDLALQTDKKPSENKIIKVKEKIDEIAGLYSVDIVFISDLDDEFKEIIFSTGQVIYEKGN